MEAVVFVGGVSLGQPATSIPLAAIVGLICGLVCGYLIYAFASRTTLTIFMVVMTNFILLIGAGLFSKAVWAFQENAFNHLLGVDVDDTGGDGPGSFNVRGNVWHLDCCNPENNFDNSGWTMFSAIFGWTNSATIGSILSYVFYWIAVMCSLIYLKFKEGRTMLLGRESAAGKRRRERAEIKAIAEEASG
ncbi:Iron transporter FTH1 [Grifola frondosa]|uniref:Iron transporter FTH1 n=1 Tax=Grifola frondosa TaxID=5627 RepID=A0A1C7MMK2_GRIFR|nr:Iron transporter FTH1 [Grifola frondosa]